MSLSSLITAAHPPHPPFIAHPARSSLPHRARGSLVPSPTTPAGPSVARHSRREPAPRRDPPFLVTHFGSLLLGGLVSPLHHLPLRPYATVRYAFPSRGGMESGEVSDEARIGTGETSQVATGTEEDWDR